MQSLENGQPRSKPIVKDGKMMWNEIVNAN